MSEKIEGLALHYTARVADADAIYHSSLTRADLCFLLAGDRPGLSPERLKQLAAEHRVRAQESVEKAREQIENALAVIGFFMARESATVKNLMSAEDAEDEENA